MRLLCQIICEGPKESAEEALSIGLFVVCMVLLWKCASYVRSQAMHGEPIQESAAC